MTTPGAAHDLLGAARHDPTLCIQTACHIPEVPMQIRVINPNTTASMTAKIGAAARAVAAAGTEIVAVQPSFGAASIEDHHDDVWAAAGVAEQVRAGEAAGASAYVIACFGDPGLHAARELARGPVVGIAEAAFHTATLLATGFSVVTTLTRTCVIAEHLVLQYGFERRCRGIHGTDIAVLELEDPKSLAFERVLASARHALDHDRSGAIVLGCAGMADLCAELQQRLGVPVIDGVAAAVKLAEGLVCLGLGTSKQGDYAAPIAKRYAGLAEPYSPG
jgi:allantoin racemase